MIIFKEDFTKKNFGWGGSQVVAANRLLPQTAIARKPGKPSLQVAIWPGDCPLQGLTTERNEVLQMTGTSNDVDGKTPAEYYAVSFFLPSGWQDTKSSNATPWPWLTPLQLHGPDTPSLSPAFELDFSSNPGRYTLIVRGGEITKPVIKSVDLGVHVYGRWVDFVFKLQSGKTSTWIRIAGTQDLLYNGSVSSPNLYTKNGVILPHYWKHGGYRCAADFTTMFYSSELVRASTFEEAAYLAFWV